MVTSHQIVCVSPSLAASLDLLTHCRNVASLSLFYRYYFGITFHLNWLNWIHFLIPVTGPPANLIVCKIFLSLFLDVEGLSMSTVSFLAQLYALLYGFHLFLLFLVTLCVVVAVQKLHGVKPN